MKKILRTCLLAALASNAWAASIVGQVVFSLGETELQRDGKHTEFVRGDTLREGDVLITGGNGHVHVRTVDQGFISLRPNSRLIVEQYAYQADKPKETTVRYRLEQGVMRSVTGRGAEQAKERFRLNTPVAAIGIRGTDFSVYADAAETRVAIRSGGVAVAPFGGDCQREALGPCMGVNVQELVAGQLDQLLRVRSGDTRPVLLKDQHQKLSPEIVAPPMPEEKLVSVVAANSTPAPVAGAGPQPGKPETPGTPPAKPPEEAPAASPSPTPQPPVTQPPVVTPLPDLPAPPPAKAPDPIIAPPASVQYAKVDWGRWGRLGAETGGRPTLEDMIYSGAQLMYSNANYNYGIVRTEGRMNLPESGIFNFKVLDYQADVRVPDGKGSYAVSGAELISGRLSIDFDRKEASTNVEFKSNLVPGVISIYSKGGELLGRPGIYGSDAMLSNANVMTVLSGDAETAISVIQSTELARPHSDVSLGARITWSK